MPVPIPARGISNQPPHLRLPGQCTEAKNCHVSVVDGTSKRPGTEYRQAVTLVGGENYRTSPLVIDDTEQYVMLFGKPATTGITVFRVFRMGGAEASVTIATAAQTYLNNANADQLRCIPIDKDSTLLTAINVVAGTVPAPTYSVAGIYRDYGIMTAQTPADASYSQAREQDLDANKPAGYYQYNVNGTTFATIKFAVVTGRELASSVGIYDNTLDSPMGFSITFRKYDIQFTGGTWTAGTLTLTKTGAFANYVFQDGDYIQMEATGGLAAGPYRITSRVNANSITLATSPGADTGSAQVIYGVIVTFDVQRPNNGVALADMFAVAEDLQTALRVAGADDALISWTPVGSLAGYFTVTSPFRGAGATVYSVGAPSTGYDLTGAGQPFALSGSTITAGAGTGSLTLTPASRWTQVSQTGSADGGIDSTKFPVKLTRVSAGNFTIDPVIPTPRMSGDGKTNPSPSIFQKSGTVTAVTATNPASLTAPLHGRRTGDVVALAGLTHPVDGSYPVTVIDDNTFTVPVTGVGTGGTGTWTKGGSAITDIAVHRGRLGIFGGSFAVFSRANDFFNFYLADYQNVVDSDPVDAPFGGKEVVNVDFVADFNGTLMAFSKGGRQYVFGSPDALTPSSASWTARTRYVTYSIRPASMGPYLYFLGPRTNKSVAWEMYFDALNVIYNAGEISAHVRDLLPMSLRSMCAGVNEYVLIVLPTGNGSTSKLFVYRAFWDNTRKEQSEWVDYVFDSQVRLVDVCVVKGDAILLTETTGLITSITAAGSAVVTTQTNHGHISGDTVYLSETQSTPSIDGARVITVIDATSFSVPVTTTVGANNSAGVGRWSNTDYMLEKLSLSREDPQTGYPYTIHLDRRIELTGVFAAGNTTWTLPFPAPGSTLNRAVLKTSGTVVDLSTAVYSGNTIVIAGNYAGLAFLGRNFDFQLQLTPPYFRDGQGVPDQMIAILLSSIVIAYQNSGDFSVRCDYDDARADITTSFAPVGVIDTGRFVDMTEGDGEHMTVYIESNSPKQLTISAYQQQGDYAFGIRNG
jgi:hypothetical protein